MTRRNTANKETRRFKLLIFGTLGAFIVFFIISFILSLLAYTMNDPLGVLGIMSLLSIVVSAAVSGFAISRIGGEGGMLTSILSSLLFSLIMLLAGFIVSGGKMPISCFINHLIYMAVSALFAYFAGRRPKKHRRKF